MNPSISPLRGSRVYNANLAKATSLGEGNTEFKTGGVLFRESVANQHIILLLSTHPKSMAGSTQAFTTINKSLGSSFNCLLLILYIK